MQCLALFEKPALVEKIEAEFVLFRAVLTGVDQCGLAFAL